MKARSIVLVLAAAIAATAQLSVPARAGEATFSNDELVDGAFDTLPIAPRYPRPSAVGGIDAMPPASALTPVPPNVLHMRHEYALGEASVEEGGFPGGDAKGRATHDRHRHRRTAWTRHAFD